MVKIWFKLSYLGFYLYLFMSDFKNIHLLESFPLLFFSWITLWLKKKEKKNFNFGQMEITWVQVLVSGDCILKSPVSGAPVSGSSVSIWELQHEGNDSKRSQEMLQKIPTSPGVHKKSS